MSATAATSRRTRSVPWRSARRPSSNVISAQCDACRIELRWLEPAVDLLPRSIEQLEPPDALRGRLMATVRAEARG